MQIEVMDNPNCRGSEQFMFRELEGPRPVRAIRVSEGGAETDCDVVGVDAHGRFVQAFAVKIADSGNGVAYLIRGGEWGLRLRLAVHAGEDWDLAGKHQRGEPFKIYGEAKDILYA